jgi:hypothetical protein
LGDVVLVDTTRPVRLFAENNSKGPWRNLAINLPRRELVAHLGSEPQGGAMRPNGTPAGRLMFELIQTANEEPPSESSSADSYMQLVVYDLVGALFAPSDQSCGSRHADKLFARARGVINQAMPTQTSVLPRWWPGQEFRYAICRSCSRSAVQPTVN